MNNELFNSVFEMKLRLLLLLSVANKNAMSVERLVGLDFIVCYPAEFNLPYSNLHGQNGFKYSELSNRRNLAYEAVKLLIKEGLANVRIENGYLFSISAEGKKYARKFESSYSVDYRKIAKDAIKEYKNNTDDGIMATIQAKSLASLKG